MRCPRCRQVVEVPAASTPPPSSRKADRVTDTVTTDEVRKLLDEESSSGEVSVSVKDTVKDPAKDPAKAPPRPGPPPARTRAAGESGQKTPPPADIKPNQTSTADKPDTIRPREKAAPAPPPTEPEKQERRPEKQDRTAAAEPSNDASPETAPAHTVTPTEESQSNDAPAVATARDAPPNKTVGSAESNSSTPKVDDRPPTSETTKTDVDPPHDAPRPGDDAPAEPVADTSKSDAEAAPVVSTAVADDELVEPVDAIPAAASAAEPAPNFDFIEGSATSDSTEVFPQVLSSDEAYDDHVVADPTKLAVSRTVVLLQGVLIGSVAVVFFILGMMVGRSSEREPTAMEDTGPCWVSGEVAYLRGGREAPDEGSVAILVPSGQQPDVKTPIDGLRTADPKPSDIHSGVQSIHGYGGDFVRVDAQGKFRLRAPRSGKYYLLVISRNRKRPSSDGINRRDLAQIGRYFLPAVDLLDDRDYQVTELMIRRDRTLGPVVFGRG